MAMRPCKKCLENRWSFEKLDTAYIRATCQGCGAEVEWTNDKLQRKKHKTYALFVPQFSEEEIRNQSGPPPWDI
jgi:hypothetical protein